MDRKVAGKETHSSAAKRHRPAPQSIFASAPILEPLLKWPGGKRWLVPEIHAELQFPIRRYFEPFLGGAAVFLSVRPNRAILSDTNEELMNVYVQVRDKPDELARLLSKLHNTATDYYRVRATRPRTPIGRAARLIYLMRLSFNGIHRVNLSGQFNVPYGRKRHLSVTDPDHLHRLSKAFTCAELLVSDFESATASAGIHDVVYFDPPYTVAHGNNGFVKYNETIFSWDDQVRLAAHARRLGRQGAHVLISNADHKSIRDLYKGFKVRTVSRFSRIAAESQHRKVITEVLMSIGGG